MFRIAELEHEVIEKIQEMFLTAVKDKFSQNLFLTDLALIEIRSGF